MYEHLAPLFGGLPNQYHLNLYSQWAKHDWGMIITGNVQVSSRHLSLGRDLIIPKELNAQTIEAYKKLADCIHKSGGSGERRSGSLAIMQLNHSGRQSSNIIGGRFPFQPPLAPSAVRIRSKRKNFVSRIVDRILNIHLRILQ